jgi:sterol desaturase/sphingolipid hydroxylase (fatty acid hydroxylase superfamily)
MDTITNILGYLLFPLFYIMQPTSQFFLPTYLAAGVAAIALYMVFNRRGRLSIVGAIQLVLPRRIVRHASSWLDLKLFFVGSYYVLLQALLVGGATFVTVPGAVNVLNHVFGAAPTAIGPSYVVTGLTMLSVFIAIEFGYWVSHFMMHKIPALWEFHKVHHSAEVLTPLTEWRQHPLELALFPILMSGASCLVQGPFVWYFGASAQVVNPVTANLISMAFWYTILHLRHSELPFYATGLLGKIIQAPAHHQVHHSTNPKHFDKNLGYCLSIFDWIFGTLYVPRKGEKFSFGLGHKDSALETAIGSMIAPFGRAAKILTAPLRRGKKEKSKTA